MKSTWTKLFFRAFQYRADISNFCGTVDQPPTTSTLAIEPNNPFVTEFLHKAQDCDDHIDTVLFYDVFYTAATCCLVVRV